MFGGFLFLPQYLQLVRGLSPLEAGLWTLPWARRVHRRLDADAARRSASRARRYVMAGGLLLAPSGFALFTQLEAASALRAVRSIDGRCSRHRPRAGVHAHERPVVGAAPPERAGAASAISETSAEFGGALGIAVFGSIGVAVYRGAMGERDPERASRPRPPRPRATPSGARCRAAAQLPAEVGRSSSAPRATRSRRGCN